MKDYQWKLYVYLTHLVSEWFERFGVRETIPHPHPFAVSAAGSNENIIQNYLNIALMNVFSYLNGRYRHIFNIS